MKQLIQISIFLITLIVVSTVKVFGQGQACITFHSDYSGLEWNAAERASITSAACGLRTLIADAGVSGFKVHTFGFYGYNPNMQGGTEAVWQEFLASHVDTSTPHLAIGKEINLDGSFKKFWVSFHVPAQGLLSCITTVDKNSIISILSSLNASGQAGFPSPQNIILKAKSLTSIIICKCGAQAGNRSGCAAPDLNYIEDKLSMLGYANYNHLENIIFESKTYTGALSGSKKITLTINSTVASPESFPSGKFELTDELNEFLSEVGGAAVVHYIDKNNINQFDDILNGGPTFTRNGNRSGASYLEKIFLLNLNGQVKVYYTIDADLPGGSGARAGGIGAIGQKFIKWFCKRAASTPLGTIGGVIVDYAAEATIEYFFNNDDNKYSSYIEAFYEVAYRRGIVGLAISVGTNLFDSPLVNFVGAFLNHFITKPYEQWNPLLAFAEAALGTLIQGCGAQVKNIPAVQKYIANILIDVGKKPGIFKHFILYPPTLSAWRKLKDIDSKVYWARQNLDLLSKMSLLSKAKQEKIAQLYDVSMKINTPSGFKGSGYYGKGNIKVEFSSFGFPKLKKHVSSLDHIVEIPNMDGTLSDYTAANDLLKSKLGSLNVRNFQQSNGSPIEIKIGGVWKGPFTWHHHENGSSMLPVKKEIHDAISGMHIGGNRIMDSTKSPDYTILKGFFPLD